MIYTCIGKLRNVERMNSSRSGNPRFAAILQTDRDELLPVRTGVDSCLAYSFTNYREGERLRVTVKLVRGHWTIQDMERAAIV